MRIVLCDHLEHERVKMLPDRPFYLIKIESVELRLCESCYYTIVGHVVLDVMKNPPTSIRASYP